MLGSGRLTRAAEAQAVDSAPGEERVDVDALLDWANRSPGEHRSMSKQLARAATTVLGLLRPCLDEAT